MGNANRPKVQTDSDYIFTQDSATDEKFRGDYLAGTDLIYKGFARPGSATSQPVWQIAKLTYDGNHNPTQIDWPQTPQGVASNDYIFIWDNRATYTYS